MKPVTPIILQGRTGTAPIRPFAAALLLASAALLTCPTARAVIVAGANGGGNTANNTTRAGLEAAVGTPFPLFDNVFNYSDATGIYLGYNPSTFDVWVISARHVSPSGATITLDSLSYSFQQRIDLSGDIALIRYTRPDNQMPGLSAAPLAQSLPGTANTLVMIGQGKNRVQDASTDANTSDAISINGNTGYNWASGNIKRWGTNNQDNNFALNGPGPPNPLGTINFGSFTSTGYSATFNQPSPGEWLSTNEAIGSLGDSGGGAFFFDGTDWVLSGIFSAVTRFSDQPDDTSVFGNATLITDINTYREEILGVTGFLIPEPGTATLLLLPAAVILLRRQRAA